MPLFSVLFAFLLQVTPLAAVCPQFGVPVSGTGYDRAWNEYTLDAADIQAVLNFDASRSFWVGYDAGGFAMPDDAADVLNLTLYTADGGERWFDVLYSPQTPAVYYALPFANTQAYADAQGQHYGTHPCAAILMTRAEYAALIAALEG